MEQRIPASGVQRWPNRRAADRYLALVARKRDAQTNNNPAEPARRGDNGADKQQARAIARADHTIAQPGDRRLTLGLQHRTRCAR